jgi:hypothetical protein
MRRLTLLLLPLLFIVPTFAKDKNKGQLPKLVVNAQYVLVTTYCGDPATQPLNPHIMPEDRQAVADVQRALEKWGRYQIAYRPEDAELILVVRTGHMAEGTVGVQGHADSGPRDQPADISSIGGPGTADPCGTGNTPRGVAPVANADGGDPQDMLALYNVNMGLDAPPLWRGRRPDGLKLPEMSLVQDLRTKVEAAANTP